VGESVWSKLAVEGVFDTFKVEPIDGLAETLFVGVVACGF
jgi:hypothetical protein